jgi:hypothetical protein
VQQMVVNQQIPELENDVHSSLYFVEHLVADK